ncbi:MAG: LuxR C-terminal-related transcriptional regulator [Fimbriimonadales bacterium]|jgi:DNA-binding NarL/FixJ family response regulator|nr:regulatory protein, luxR family [Armatimonadetes bacterium GXS]
MKRRKVIVLTKDPILGRLIEQLLSACPEIEPIRMREGKEAEASVVQNNLLSRAELEVLELIAKYGNVKTAAKIACRSESTLKRELANIRQKLCVRTTLQAVVWALCSGLIAVEANHLIGSAFRNEIRDVD